MPDPRSFVALDATVETCPPASSSIRLSPGGVVAGLAAAGFEIVDGGAADLAVVSLPALARLRGAVRTVVVAEAADVLAAFTAGADDVVSPRIDPAELAARAHAILRRA